MELKLRIDEFLDKRPEVVCAYGYGSGVIKQDGYEEFEKPQIDLILAVKDIRAWHLENMKRNPNDYSFTGKLFYSYASRKKIKDLNGIAYQSNIKEVTRTWFLKSKNNMKIELNVDERLFKYGVIEIEDLKHNLKTWNCFYVAGRLHKNILNIKSNQEMNALIYENRKNALLTALYLLGEVSTLDKLYETIISLSYIGDIRMSFFENPKKIRNILAKSKEDFDAIYSIGQQYFEIENDIIYINRKAVEEEPLPAYLAYALTDVDKSDREAVKKAIISFLKQKNRSESINQALHGLTTNGPLNSVNYTFQKIKKRIYQK